MLAALEPELGLVERNAGPPETTKPAPSSSKITRPERSGGLNEKASERFVLRVARGSRSILSSFF